jgi:hypothetical protein
MDSFEYMRIPIKLVPQESIEEYNVLSLVSDGHVYIEVPKGMYGLPKSGVLANKLLACRLVNTSGMAGSDILHLPLGDDASPPGRYSKQPIT